MLIVPENDEIFELLIAAKPLVDHCKALRRKNVPLNFTQETAFRDLALLLHHQGYDEQLIYSAGWSWPDVLFLLKFTPPN